MADHPDWSTDLGGRPTFTQVDEQVLHEGHTISYARGTFQGPGGIVFTREIVRHPGAVSVVAVDDDGMVILERQFRAALGQDLLEIPAGKRDVPGEPPEETARRELAEEVGLAADRWTRLAGFHNSPGFCDEHGTVYLAQGLREVPSEPQGHEEDAMTIEWHRLRDTPLLIASGQLTDAKSIIGLLLALRHLGD